MSREPIDFSVASVSDEGIEVIEVRGELDLPTAPELERALTDAEQADTVIVDTTEVTFMDSSGLRTLLVASNRFAEAAVGWGLVVKPGSAVSRLLSISEVDRHLPIYETRETARAGMPGSAG